MLLKVYKSRVWMLLFMLMPFISYAQPPGWNPVLNPTSAVYAIPTTVTFDGVDALSAGDWIGVFQEDGTDAIQCAGMVEWTGTENVAIVAFGNDTVGTGGNKNGFAPGEMVQWRFWYQGTGEEICVKSDPAFLWANGDLGEVTAFEGCETCQDVALVTGTQFISTYIEPFDLDFKNVMEDILDNLNIAKNSAGSTLRKIGPVWVNSIGNLVPTEGYIMTMNGDDMVTICGTQVPFDTPIPVTGTSVVSYLHMSSMDAQVGFGTILDNLNIAKNSAGSTLRKIGPIWVNSIGNLNAGEGYLVTMNAADEIIYPAADNTSSAGAPKKSSARAHFSWPGGNAAENTYSIYVDAAIFDGVSLEAGDEIAVFDGDKIVGVKVLAGAPTPGTFSEELAAFNVLGDLTPGYTPGNEMSFKCWDASADLESTSSSFEIVTGWGGYEFTTFPADNNLYTVATMDFVGEPTPNCPTLLTAVGGENVVDLEWEAAAPEDNISAKKTRAHFSWPGGNAAENTYSIYVDAAIFSGVSLEAGDEIAVFDGDKIVGVKVLAGAPTPGTFSEELAAFNVLGDLTPGYTPGNEMSFKCWDASTDTESETSSFEIVTGWGGYEFTTFPADNNLYTVATMEFGAGFTASFNVYFEDGTLVEANVPGLTYQVTGLEDGTEYCFYVTENLEGGGESCESNVLCATTEIGCEDAVINNWPVGQEDVCAGDELSIDFSGVEILNAESDEWLIDPVEAGVFDGDFFVLDESYVGAVTITLNAYAFEGCVDASAELMFTVNPLPEVTLMAYEPMCAGDEAFDLYGGLPLGGTYYVDGEEATTFDPAVAGDYVLLYKYADENGCIGQDEGLIVVNPLPVADCPVYEPVCIGSEAFEFPVVEGGVYTNAAMEVVTGFDPVEDGEFFFTLTVTDGNGCVASCEFSILVNPLPVAECPVYEPVCAGSEGFEFPVVEGGVYTNAAMEVVTGFDPVEDGEFFFTLTVTDGNGCVASCEFSILVNALPEVTLEAYEPLCAGDAMFALYGGLPEGGTYWVDGEEATEFDPAVAGNYPLVYEYTDENGCTNFAEGMIVVNPLPEVICPEYDPIITSEFPVVVELTGATPEGGEYSGDGVENGFLTALDYGDYDITYTYTDENGCTGECMFTISINDGGCMDAEILNWPATPDNLCTGLGLEIDFNGVEILNAETITYTVPVGAGEWIDGVFFLDPGYVGMVNIGLTAYAYVPCEDAMEMMEFEVYPLPVFDCPEYGPYCVGDETVVFEGEGVYTYEGEVVVEFTPEFAGDYVFMYTVTSEFGCSDYCEFTIVVNPLPEVTCPDDFAVCLNDEPWDLWGGEPEGGDYSGPGVTDNMFDPAAAGVGTWDIVYSYTDPETGCYAECGFAITVNPLPSLEFNASAEEICLGETVDVSFTGPEDGAYPYVVDITLGGLPLQFVLETNYFEYPFTPEMAMTYEFVVVMVTDANGCYIEPGDAYQLVVNPLPFIELELAATEICLGEEVIGTITGPEDGAYPYTVEYTINGEPFTDVIEGTPLEIPLMPEFAGTYTLEVQSVVDANGCWADAVEGVELVVLPLTEITLQPVSVDVLYGGTAVFTVEADNATGYQWFGPDGEILGAMDATFTIDVVMPEDAGDYYCMVYGECGEVMSDIATLGVLPWEQCIDLLAAVNGASTYLDLLDDDVATVFAPVNLNAVEFYAPSQVYVPGGASFGWDEAKGAKVSLVDGFPTQVCVEGWPTLGTDLTVPAGWSLLPVWSYDVVNAADVFDPLGDNLIAVLSIDYSGIYWPSQGIYTLDFLVPGSAYLIALAAEGTVSYDVPPADAMVPSFVAHPANNTSWNDVTMTGVQHTISITTAALEGLQIGDVIGAFNQYGAISGMVEVTNLKQNIALRVYGDNFATQKTDGFINGDVMTFKVYRDGEIINAEVSFDQNMPNTNVFVTEGLSAITELKAGVTSISDPTADMFISVYPNPATDYVNIQTNFEISNLKVVNYVGQVVFDQDTDQMIYQINTSHFSPGMYFVQIENAEGTVVTKRLTVN